MIPTDLIVKLYTVHHTVIHIALVFSCSYEHEVLNTSRTDQQKNPQLFVSSKTPYVFDELQQLLEIAARDVRYLLSEEICVEDDEDQTCVDPDDYCNIPITPQLDIEYSGSGQLPVIPTIPTDYPTVGTVPTKPPSNQPSVSVSRGTTRPPEWTTDPDTTDYSDLPTTDGSASSVPYSLYVVLLLSIVVLL